MFIELASLVLPTFLPSHHYHAASWQLKTHPYPHSNSLQSGPTLPPPPHFLVWYHLELVALRFGRTILLHLLG